MPNTNANVKKCAAIISKAIPGFKPKIGIILGSGLGAISNQIENASIIDYQDLPGFYVTHIAGHNKRMHLGMLKGVPVVCLEGRTHYYEGEGSTESIKTIIRTLKAIGCDTLLTTNAVGSLLIERGPGNLMVIKDHINFTFQNPLMGPNDDEFGERFVSMDNAYDSDLRQNLLDIAKNLNIPISSGIYIATSGPTFETHAEIRMFKMLGGDAVGMSTVPETIVARHCGLKVASVCAITNLGAGLSKEIITHEGTLRGAKLATNNLIQLFLAFIESIAKNKN
ncbi:MAG: purine-nucleoside phosphorylase [Gammaproteobacteria bacterium]|nr:purine-nucleoside phosphorylase [Gammaproteobacteria bacterium]